MIVLPDDDRGMNSMLRLGRLNQETGAVSAGSRYLVRGNYVEN